MKTYSSLIIFAISFTYFNFANSTTLHRECGDRIPQVLELVQEKTGVNVDASQVTCKVDIHLSLSGSGPSRKNKRTSITKDVDIQI